MKKYITEFIGTFFFVLTIGCTVEAGAIIPPLAIGSALMVMIYAGGRVSGGHYNPAVTLGVWIRGGCNTKDVLPYILAQIAGAFCAALAVNYFEVGRQVSPVMLNPGPAFLAEFLFTYALVYVVLNVATTKDTAGNSYYGLAIGFTVMVGAFAVGTISSAAFNPAVAIGLSMMGLSAWSNLWIYILANCIGGAFAGVTYNLINGERILPSWKRVKPQVPA